MKINSNSNTTLQQLYKPLLVLLLICGYNFDFYNYNSIFKIAIKSYCVTLVAVVVYATLLCCELTEIARIWSMTEYSTSVIAILFFKSQIVSYFQKLTKLDTYLRINQKNYLYEKYKIFVSTIFVWFIRIFYTYVYCISYKCYNDLGLYMMGQFSLMALDLNRVWRFILYDMIRFRLKMLRIRLEESPEYDFYLYVDNNKSIKENKIRFCLQLYRSIADLVDLVSPEVHASLFISVICNLPKLIISVYNILLVIENHVPFESLGFVVMHVFQICLLLFTPFVVIEFYAIEVEKIRLFLMHKLIDENDPRTKEDISLFLRYTELRNFKYRIWRIIPVNIAVPLEFVNICLTYVIVIVNFTHLYG